jgi:hypothetical protein
VVERSVRTRDEIDALVAVLSGQHAATKVFTFVDSPMR